MDTSPPATLIAQADAARDAGAWRDAARLYAAHLGTAQNDWGIWVQHGHCLREAGDAEGALASYRRAEAGRPDDADVQLHLGHALRLTGDAAGARAAYGRALDLDPAADAPWQEVLRLLATPGGAAAPGLSLLDDLRLVFDVSDLFSWFGTHRAASGIQRIQVEIAEGARAGFATIRHAVFLPERAAWREMPPEAFRRLVGLSRLGADPSDPAWRETRSQVAALLDASPDMAFEPGEWLVNLGTSWQLDGYHQAVREAKGRGLRHAALVHDAGPVTVPEHGPPEVAARFAQWFAGLGATADLVLAVSEATRADIERLAARAMPGLPFPPVRVLRPDAAPRPLPLGDHPRLAEMLAEPFVLFVATIESRKDHLFVLNAWLALLRRDGARLPRLLLVGRAGFGGEPAIALLRRAPALEGRVVWLDDVSDGALAVLRARCLFAIHHAAYEGWGLPVTEALAAGKALVAPAHSGLLEAAQGLALSYAPGSEPEFVAAIERLLFEPGARETAEARIAAALRLRDWGAVAQELLDILHEALPAPADAPPPALGVTHPLGLPVLARPSLPLAWAERLREGRGWRAPEAWGCWTRPGRAMLRLPLPDGSGKLRLHLALRGAPAARQVVLRVGRGARVTLEVPAEARPVTVLAVPEGAAEAAVTIETTVAEGDPAPGIGVGVVALMACAAGDVASRLAFLERLSFVWPDPA
ncbi:glycosyltransferase [Falsiroseomonas sp. HW251]|uniref:glycosyltransferase n=1 Tax=Falsiroseomonas sp. HW251 TaxID=3390998 RepID=UPI003D31279E